MKKIIKKLGIAILLASLLLTACGKNEGQGEDTSHKESLEISETETETEVDTETEANTESDTESDTESETESETESDTESETETEGEDENKLLDLNEYAIIRGFGESTDVLTVLSGFYFTLIDEYGFDVDFYVDEDVKPSGKELVFGATDRRADKNHRYSDYSIEYEDGNVYICGGSAEAMGAAVEWLCENCLSAEGLSVEALPFEYNATYELDGTKVCGVPISEFVLDGDENELTAKLLEWLAPRAGLRKSSDEGYTVKFETDETLCLDEIEVGLTAKTLKIRLSAHLDDLSGLANALLSFIESNKGKDMNFSGAMTIDLPAPQKPLTDVREITDGNIDVSVSFLGSYKVGDEIIAVCTLTSGGKAVACPEFTWIAEYADGETCAGATNGAYGKAVIKIPAAVAGRLNLKVLVRDEEGKLIPSVEQSEDFAQSPLFSITVKDGKENSGMKEIPTCFETTPIVYAVGDEYQIIVPVKAETLMWVGVGDQLFYDESNGILRSNTITHKMTVPQKLLDEAGEYTVYYRIVYERKPYNSNVSQVYEFKSDFRAVTGDNPRFFHIADAHNRVDEPVAAAKAYGDIDFLILNGDIPDDAGNIKNFSTIHRIASEITGGEIPVVFSRGNHDMRGIYAENLEDHTPTDKGNSYFTFRLGSIWGIVLDCGEDKPDTHPEYGNTVSCEEFRKRQIDFINSVIANAENEYAAEGVEYSMVIVHDPFTEYKPTQLSETDLATYTEWARLLREYVKPDVMISGHVHQAYITEVGGELDRIGQPCPVVVGSAPGTKISLSLRGVWVGDVYVGTGFELVDGQLSVTFIGHNGITYYQSMV